MVGKLAQWDSLPFDSIRYRCLSRKNAVVYDRGRRQPIVSTLTDEKFVKQCHWKVEYLDAIARVTRIFVDGERPVDNLISNQCPAVCIQMTRKMINVIIMISYTCRISAADWPPRYTALPVVEHGIVKWWAYQ